jgi:hypothetical protein
MFVWGSFAEVCWKGGEGLNTSPRKPFFGTVGKRGHISIWARKELARKWVSAISGSSHSL